MHIDREYFMPEEAFHLPEDELVCRNCVYWGAGENAEIDVQVSGRTGYVRMQECCAQEMGDDDAPEVPILSYYGAAIFTDDTASCAAFRPNPDALAEMAAEAAHYDWLCEDRWRDAWRGAQ
ncbi:MAG: hypothetical protein DELT_01706 [Desulfovibrio sp.]